MCAPTSNATIAAKIVSTIRQPRLIGAPSRPAPASSTAAFSLSTVLSARCAPAVHHLVEAAREGHRSRPGANRRAASPLVSESRSGSRSARPSRISPARKRSRSASSNSPRSPATGRFAFECSRIVELPASFASWPGSEPPAPRAGRPLAWPTPPPRLPDDQHRQNRPHHRAAAREQPQRPRRSKSRPTNENLPAEPSQHAVEVGPRDGTAGEVRSARISLRPGSRVRGRRQGRPANAASVVEPGLQCGTGSVEERADVLGPPGPPPAMQPSCASAEESCSGPGRELALHLRGSAGAFARPRTRPRFITDGRRAAQRRTPHPVPPFPRWRASRLLLRVGGRRWVEQAGAARRWVDPHFERQQLQIEGLAAHAEVEVQRTVTYAAAERNGDRLGEDRGGWSMTVVADADHTRAGASSAGNCDGEQYRQRRVHDARRCCRRGRAGRASATSGP